jgi:LPXTG-motif cell wall-anchored protein
MAFEDIDFDNNDFEIDPEGTPPPEESGNRTFYIVAGVIGGIMLLALIFMALYAVFIAPQQQSTRATQDAQLAVKASQETEMAIAAQETALAALFSATPTVTSIPPTATASPSATLVIALPTDVLVTPTIDRTATVSALLTEAAAAQLTATPTPSSLPDTGFVEDVGVPVMVGLALVLVVIIFLARRLRSIG